MAQAKVGYAAMLEQFGPTEVVEYSALAEQHGFTGVMAADHFQPWVPQQGQAAFVWNVMTAIAGRTTGDIGPGDAEVDGSGPAPGKKGKPADATGASEDGSATTS